MATLSTIASISQVAGIFVSPLLQVALDHLVRLLSSSRPPSSIPADQHQQLRNHLKSLQDAMVFSEGPLRLAEKLQGDHKSVAYFLRQLKDVIFDAEDLVDELGYFEFAGGVANQVSSSSSSLISHEIGTRLEEIVGNLNRITEKLERAIENAMRYVQVEALNQDPRKHAAIGNNRLTTSFAQENGIFGRDYEKKQLMDMVIDFDASECVSVVPILGMGGVGKTALAQWVYNNEEVTKHFQTRAWVCVSDVFDKERIIREIVESVSTHGIQNISNLNKQVERAVECLRDKRFLLVLDDVWSHQWTEVLHCLNYAKAKSIKIVVTSREKVVVNGLGKRNEIVLKGLEDDIYWSFFLRCAFGNEDADDHVRLQSIGRQIVKKLKGSPLAAKTMGRLLGSKLDEEHWSYVLKSKLWELGKDANEIMPALALSYNHLPPNLQQCFAFCSVYPKDYQFEMKSLVSMWIAQDYVEAKTNLTLEEVGEEYFEELLCRSFFEPSRFWGYFTMHDLLHDLAESVSLHECFVYEGQKVERNLQAVRHLCVHTNVDLNLVCDFSKLRTLLLFGSELHAHMLPALKRVRVLVLDGYEMKELPDVNGNLKHLRYLDLHRTSIEKYPESWCKLYNLHTLELPQYISMPISPNLINLRHLIPSSNYRIPGIGNMTCLQELQEFFVKKDSGYGIENLKKMNEMRGCLKIKNLENVGSEGEACGANLKGKSLLDTLELHWSLHEKYGERDNKQYLSNEHYSPGVAEQVLEGLQPHSDLKMLHVFCYMGSRSPNWLHSLQNLRVVGLYKCRNWAQLSPIVQLPFLESLSMEEMDVIVGSGNGVAVVFPSLRFLRLYNASVLFEGMMSSVTTQGYSFFPHLHVLTVFGPEQLFSAGSIGLSFQLPQCLKGLTSLRFLTVSKVKEACFPGTVISNSKAIQTLEITECVEMSCVGGLQALISLRYLTIANCPKLTSWLTERTEHEFLLPELRHLEIRRCDNLESLPNWLPQLCSLERLWVYGCPSIMSLPEGGLPLSLRDLRLDGCSKGLVARCKEEGSLEWQMIQHIPLKTLH